MDKILVLVIVFAAAKLSNASDNEIEFDKDHVVYRGFPVGVICSLAMSFLSLAYGFDDTTLYTTCIIEKDGVEVFHRKTNGSSVLEMGIFEEADDTWDNASINVTIISDSGAKALVRERTTVLKDTPKFECPSVSKSDDVVRTTTILGKSHVLPCHHDVPGISYPVKLHIPYYLKPNYTAWWYKGCHRIERDDPDYEYIDDTYVIDAFEGTVFASLKVKNASLTSTIGEYFCVLENSNDPDTTFQLSTTPVCVKKEFQYLNSPSIKLSQKQYTVEPGSDVEVQATGHIADHTGVLSRVITWTHNTSKGSEQICSNTLGMDDSPNCKEVIHKNKRYCEPVPQDEIQNIFLQHLDDNFTATLVIRDARKEHEGTYVVTFSSSQEAVSDSFTLRVDNTRAEPVRWTVALIVAAALVVVAVAMLILLHKKRTDVRYIMKKICGSYQRTNKPMAFLIYSRDVSNEMPKVLDIVTQFFGGRRYYDANNVAAGAIETNQVGMLVHEHVVLMMGQSLSVVIFVTENLLAGNDMENFEVYQGLEENIRQALPLIFICTKTVRRKVLDGEFDGVSNALKKFMSHQKSKVIIWDENNVSSFRRGLYVALPKVPHIGVEAETKESLYI